MNVSEKVELLGKGLYTDIPDELTLKSMPTISELDYVGSEDFEATMLDKILPEAVEEKVDFRQLLEIDFQWICRCLRLLNFGPYHTATSIFCDKCGKTSFGEFQVNLQTIECKTLPEGFVNDIVIKKDEFIDFEGEVHFKLPTIQQTINAYKDKAFQTPSGKINRELARICYMVSSIKGKSGLTPIEVKLMIQKELSPADYLVLKERVDTLSDYGLRAGGSAQCPKCGSKEAAFIALVDDRYFRPTMGNLRQWKHDRSSGSDKDISTSSSTAVRKHN